MLGVQLPLALLLFAAGQPARGGHDRRSIAPGDDVPRRRPTDLCAAVRPVTGDARVEIILWDRDRVWIDTQDRPFNGPRIDAPRRNPDDNDSNDRAEVSLPNREAPQRAE